MRVIVFGGTGMVGQGVLRECVLDPEVEAVVSVVRRASGPSLGRKSEKVREVVVSNFFDYSKIESNFSGYDTCFFCLGVSSFRMKEAEYQRVTFDLTMAAAQAVLRQNPTWSGGGMTFLYVSGAGTDSTEHGRVMWSRVKGSTENALLGMGFKAAYMIRPGVVMPLHGIISKTPLYRVVYTGLRPFLPVLLKVFPQYVTTTEQVGRAMLSVAKHGYAKPVLEAADIARVG